MSSQSKAWDDVAVQKEDELDLQYQLEEIDNDEEDNDILDTVEDIHEKAGPTPQLLEEDKDEEVVEAPETKEVLVMKRETSKMPKYRIPLTPEEASEHKAHGGLLWEVRIFKDGYKNKKYLTPSGQLKPRRAIPQVYASDFFSSLNKTDDGRWVFKGALNGWPALTNMELLALEFWYRKQVGKQAYTYTKRYWKKVEGGKKVPAYPKAGSGFFINAPKMVRATLQMPAWSEIGFSKDNPGFMWYYAQFREGGPKITHGLKAVQAIQEDAAKAAKPVAKAVRAHYWGHRYAKNKESLKDRITYHTGVLLEWDHGQYTTIIELTWLRGMGGYAGNSNWCEDSYSGKRTKLYQAMPDCLKAPWDTHRSEIRIIDHISKDLNEFKQYLKKYEGARFVNPEIKASADVRLTFRGLDHIAQYANNYSLRDTSYSEAQRNCQTFAVDFFTFLTGKIRDAEPYYPVKVLYKERRHMFMYEPSMFDKKKKGSKKDKSK